MFCAVRYLGKTAGATQLHFYVWFLCEQFTRAGSSLKLWSGDDSPGAVSLAYRRGRYRIVGFMEPSMIGGDHVVGFPLAVGRRIHRIDVATSGDPRALDVAVKRRAKHWFHAT